MRHTTKARWYVGHKGAGSVGFVAFQSATEPTERTHGDRFAAVIGPFDTKRAAVWAEAHGANNPHFLTVADAERIAAWESRS